MAIIGLIDYGAGNFASVWHALKGIGADVVRVDDAVSLERATHLILPGVGTFAASMRRLESSGLVQAIREQLSRQQKPFLGICVGMQLLATVGREFEECRGLGCVDGVVERIPGRERGLRLPHMGWNEITIVRPSPLFKDVVQPPLFYFAHSYQLQPADESTVVATCDYGGEIVAAIQCRNVHGVQFHPEKSQRDGLMLLSNFVSL